MRRCQTPLFALLILCGCNSPARAPRDPGSPTPIAEPRLPPDHAAPGRPNRPDTDARRRSEVPMRPSQAPLVAVREALETDSLLGRRVRVSGRCAAKGEGRRAGSWTLDQSGVTIEVRGLVPSSCTPDEGEELTIFAQIEPRAPDSRDRILLRLPD
jgi:hypothetical protein